jgi:hypothetical protein
MGASQRPQSARYEDKGDVREAAERPECPDEEEAAASILLVFDSVRLEYKLARGMRP